MAKIVIAGAGFAGHTAALYLGSALGKDHEITVINMSDRFLFVPSLVWVGVGHMEPEKTRFKLEPVYRKLNIRFLHGKLIEVHPDENYAVAERKEDGQLQRLDYDYLLIATGAKLDFEATPGLGPEKGNTYSICTMGHAIQAKDAYLEAVERMKRREKQVIVVGTGHPRATCQGAAFEYITNIHKDLVKRGLRDRAELIWFSNEPVLGDFGIGGLRTRKGGRVLTSEEFVRNIFEDYDIKWQIGRGVKYVEKGKIYWEDLEGNEGETPYDFAMLLPKFSGMPIKFVDKDGKDITSKMTNSDGFILVDGIYDLPYEKLVKTPEAWPAYYQNPDYPNIFAAGIAFAPPGPISKPHVNPKGTSITPSPPRTGMASGIMGRIVALNIIDLVKKGRMTHHARMSDMFVVCIASMGDSLWDGAAAVIVVYPIVPDYRRFPNEEGRDLFVCNMEVGLAGAWMKRLIHTTFMYKYQAYPGWKIIPE